jgi:hypothetical protein
MALLVFVASNGIALSEHICKTSKTHDFSIFKEAQCEMEKPLSSCCAKKMEKKKDCCEHKQLFKKLSVEGFTSKLIKLKSHEKLVLQDYWINSHLFSHQNYYHGFITGIPPPDNLYTIKYLLRPTPVELQTFRC